MTFNNIYECNSNEISMFRGDHSFKNQNTQGGKRMSKQQINWHPEIIMESVNGRQPISLKSMLFDEGIIMIDREIDDELATDFIMQLRYLESREMPATIVIASPGGSVTAGLQMYDMMQGYPYELKTVATGLAASMASLLFTCAPKENRYMLPHARIMIHEVLVQQAPGGSASDMEEFAKSLVKSKEAMNELLAKHTGQEIKRINKDTRHDKYFTAKEAIEYGLADKIVERF